MRIVSPAFALFTNSPKRAFAAVMPVVNIGFPEWEGDTTADIAWLFRRIGQISSVFGLLHLPNQPV